MTMRLASAVLVLGAACGSSSGPMVVPDGGPADGGPVDAGPPNMRTIGVQGGTVRTLGGEATLTIPPGALDGAYAFTINPGAAAGTYDFAPAGVRFRIAATVSLTAPPMEGVYVGFSGGTTTIALESRRDAEGRLAADITHLVGRYSVVPAMPVSTREQAGTLLRTGLVTLLYNPPSVVTGPMQMVKAGDVVQDTAPPSRFDGNSDFSAPPISKLPPQRYTVPGDRWFFWVDPQPTAAFNHDSLWAFVDPLRGTVLEVPAHSWPQVGSEVLPAVLEDRLKSPLKVAPLDSELGQECKPPPVGMPEGVSMTMGAASQSTAPNMCCHGTKVLIIRTADEPAFVDSETAVKTYLTNTTPGAGIPGTDITTVRAEDGDQIEAAVDALATQPGMCLCDVLIYVVSHGDEGAFVLHPKAGTPKTGEESPQYSHADFIEHLGRICAQRLNVVVESCQAGTMHEIITKARAKAATAPPGGNLEKALRPYKCLNATITTAAAKGHSAFRGVAKLDALFGAPYPMGFTSAWVSSLTKNWYKDKGDDWGAAGADASDPSLLSAFLYYQTPESKRYMAGQDCCQCCGAPDGGTGVMLPTDGPSTTLPPDASGTTTEGLKVSPINAVFRQEVFSTFYSALFTNPAAEPLTVTWSGPDCGTYDPKMATTSATAGELDLTWAHPHPPCDPTTEHAHVTVKLTVSSPSAAYECTYKGAGSGAGPVCTKTK